MNAKWKTILSNRLKTAREEADLSQKQAAIMLDVSAPTVSEWEAGKKTPSIDNLMRLSALYNRSIEYFLGISDKPAIEGIWNCSHLKQQIETQKIENLSSLVGISDTRISDICAERSAPTVSEMVLFSDALCCDIDYLLGRYGEYINLESGIKHSIALRIAAAYTRADERVKQMVDLALEPYMKNNPKEKTG